MRQVAVLPQKDRDALFRNTAVKTGMSEAVVEKDFNDKILQHFQHESVQVHSFVGILHLSY